MRLERVLPAAAIALLLVVGAFPASATHDIPSATILAPGEGATLAEAGQVRIHYAGYAPGARNISGYLLLDGTWAGSFDASVAGPPANGTTFNATLVGAGFASGAHALSAHVFSDLDEPVDAPAVGIQLDIAPRIEDPSASYDHDARVLNVTARVEDDSGPANLTLDAGGNTTTVFVSGTHTFRVSIPYGEGTYPATLTATDALGQRDRTVLRYIIVDREAEITDVHARYHVGGTLVVRANVSDFDGIKSVRVKTGFGEVDAKWRNGSWEASIPLDPRLGTHAGNLTVRDARGGNTTAAFTFVIGGEREVLFERGISTQLGAYADISAPHLPRVHGGLIEICGSGGCASNANYVGSGAILASIWEGLTNSSATRQCVFVGHSTSCGFDIHNPGGWNLLLAWGQSVGDIDVRVTGIRV